MTPPGRKFGNLKLSGLISTSVFSIFAVFGKVITRSRSPPSTSENSPEFQIAFNRFGLDAASAPAQSKSFAGAIGDVIAERVANRFAARSLVHDMSDGA